MVLLDSRQCEHLFSGSLQLMMLLALSAVDYASRGNTTRNPAQFDCFIDLPHDALFEDLFGKL